MAEAVILGALAGALAQCIIEGGAKIGLGVLRFASSLESQCKKFDETSDILQRAIDVIKSEASSDTIRGSVDGLLEKLQDGRQSVNKCRAASLYELLEKYRCSRNIQKLQKEIATSLRAHILPILVSIITERPDSSSQLEELREKLRVLASKNPDESILRQQQRLRFSAESADNAEHHSVPNMPSSVVGFDRFVTQLKAVFSKDHVNVVEITGRSGIGKSTLALAFCHDDDVKNRFGKVFHFVVSEKPEFLGILKEMWVKIVGGKPNFQNVDEAHQKLQHEIKLKANQRILVVLDDVWCQADLEKLLFQGEGYKTLVTTRNESIIPERSRTVCLYPLPLMQDEHALPLFCSCAFGQRTIPEYVHDKELVREVQRNCGGLPLVLQVIGISLRGKPPHVWESFKEKLSRAHEDIIERLKTIIDELDDLHKMPCFLDLAAFPKGLKISANVLLDIWVYVRKMKPEDALVLLCEFAARNLLELRSDPGSLSGSQSCVYDLSFTQHDVMRDLATYLAMKDNTRLYMQSVPSNLHGDTNKASAAQIVSLHTSTTKDEQWPQMELPEAEAFVLFSTASECWIPAFLHRMEKLKVLIIHNSSSQKAKLQGSNAFQTLSRALSGLETLCLERLIVPPLDEYIGHWNLKKLSLSLCEGLDSMSGDAMGLCLNLPKLLEINLDHCSDLIKLPSSFCLNSLEKLSITNCHLLCNLPDVLGNLSLLNVLRLCACPNLKELPASIGRLGKLKFLDISLCGDLKGFPIEFNNLSSLKELDIRGCSRLRNAYATIADLTSLERVFCYRDIERQLRSMSILEGEEEQFNLDWLSD